MQHNEITGAIIDTAIDIHRRLGPGLLESVYRKVLAYELTKKGFHTQSSRYRSFGMKCGLSWVSART